MARETHLSSLVVHARPDRLEAVKREIAGLGCEIHHASAAGKLVVTIETDDAGGLADTVTALQQVENVLAATLAFHHCEPAEPNEQPAPAAPAEHVKENRPCR